MGVKSSKQNADYDGIAKEAFAKVAGVRLGPFETQIVRRELKHNCDACGLRITGQRWGCAICGGRGDQTSFDLCSVCKDAHSHRLGEESDVFVDGMSGVEVLAGFASAAQVLENRLRVFAGRPAFVHPQLRSYRWIHQRALQLVNTHLHGLERVVICGGNSPEWFVVDAACILSGRLSIPIQKGLSRDAVMAVVLSNDPQIAFVDEDDMEAFASMISCRIVTLQQISSTAASDWATLLEKTPLVPRDQDAPATVISTSGSTGAPKGALIADGTLRSHLGSSFGQVRGPTVVVSYQPLALATERFLYLSVIGNRGRIHIVDASSPDFWQQVKLARPTSFNGPPRIFMACLEQFPSAKQSKDVFGDRIASVSTGGAPCPPHVRAWMKNVLGRDAAIAESYGTTEGGSISVNGILAPNIEIRTLDVPEMGYRSTDLPFPRGELVYRTAHVIRRYTGGVDSDTSAALTEDGFYRSGDIVQWDPQSRRIWVIDRLKSFVKLATGHFVACERVELEILGVPGVKQVLVTARPGERWPVAVIVPCDAHHHLLSVDSMCLPTLQPHEIPRRISFHLEPWTSENGFLTANKKLARQRLLLHFRQVIDSLYEEADEDADSNVLHTFVSRALTDSISATRFMLRMQQEQGIQIPKKIFERNVDAIVRLLQGDGGGDNDDGLSLLPPVDWMAEIGTAITTTTTTTSTETLCAFPSRRVLLTGATGFLGIFLLYELLEQDSERQVICVVRGGDTAAERLRLHASEYGVHISQWWDRIKIVSGDLEDLEMLRRVFEEQQPDLIVHAAAKINGLADYRALCASNVDVPRSLLSLGIPMAFVSTLSVFAPGTGTEETVISPANVVNWAPLMSGYSASKLVSDYIVSRSSVPNIIFRPAAIGPAKGSWKMSPNDFVPKILSSMQHLGVAPDTDATLQMVPVDFLARGIVALLRPENIGRRFHFFCGNKSPTFRDCAPSWESQHLFQWTCG